jgi:oxaloacetate decarboxylase gamma subunit
MTITEMLSQSGILTLLGMGVVFGFLVIMVIAVSLTGKVVHILGADKDVAELPKSTAGTMVQPEAVTAAITAAVTEYQKNREGVKHA